MDNELLFLGKLLAPGIPPAGILWLIFNRFMKRWDRIADRIEAHETRLSVVEKACEIRHGITPAEMAKRGNS